VKTIDEIREAFLKIHHNATQKSGRSYMSIPADPERDADLIVNAAIDELEQLRQSDAKLEKLRVVLDAILENGTESPILLDVARHLGLQDELPHIWKEKEYGVKNVGGRDLITVTGVALCCRELRYDGNWSAYDLVDAGTREMCPKCIAALKALDDAAANLAP
jgi:uncharacterized membrane protein